MMEFLHARGHRGRLVRNKKHLHGVVGTFEIPAHLMRCFVSQAEPWVHAPMMPAAAQPAMMQQAGSMARSDSTRCSCWSVLQMHVIFEQGLVA